MIGHRRRSRAMAPARDPVRKKEKNNAYFGLLYHKRTLWGHTVRDRACHRAGTATRTRAAVDTTAH
eukprot:3089044-Prymnesium_polylepis.1